MMTRITRPLAGLALLIPLTAHASDDASLLDQAKLEFSMAETEVISEPFRLFSDIDITFIPGVWLPRMRGHMSLGPSPASSPINIETGFDLRDMEATFVGELEITKHETFTLIFTGFDFSTSGSGTFPFSGVFGDITLTPGGAYSSDFELLSFSGELAVGVFRPFSALEGSPIDLRISPMFVARYIDAEMSLTAGATTTTGTGEWLAPLAGLRVEVEINPDRQIFLISGLKLDASLALGPALGGDGGFLYQIRAGVTALITDNFGVTFGYRLLDMDLDDGPLTVDTQLAGLFFGGVIRF